MLNGIKNWLRKQRKEAYSMQLVRIHFIGEETKVITMDEWVQMEKAILGGTAKPFQIVHDKDGKFMYCIALNTITFVDNINSMNTNERVN